MDTIVDAQELAVERVMVEAASKALSEIFDESGRKTVEYYLGTRYGLKMTDLVRRPDDFRTALGGILGTRGSGVVWGVLSKRVCKAVRSRSLGTLNRDAKEFRRRVCAEFEPPEQYSAW